MAKQDAILDAISIIIKNIDEIKTRLDRDDNRFQNINSRLDLYTRSLDSFNDRLDTDDRIFQCLNSRLDTHDHIFHSLNDKLNNMKTEDDAMKPVIDAVKVINDYCSKTTDCTLCMFHTKNAGCMLKDHYPTKWDVKKDK